MRVIAREISRSATNVVKCMMLIVWKIIQNNSIKNYWSVRHVRRSLGRTNFKGIKNNVDLRFYSVYIVINRFHNLFMIAMSKFASLELKNAFIVKDRYKIKIIKTMKRYVFIKRQLKCRKQKRVSKTKNIKLVKELRKEERGCQWRHNYLIIQNNH